MSPEFDGETQFDWSNTGIPVQTNNIFNKDLIFDWSASGLPSQFEVGNKPTRVREFPKYTNKHNELVINWNEAELPWQFVKAC